jgi:hypothetical protein
MVYTEESATVIARPMLTGMCLSKAELIKACVVESKVGIVGVGLGSVYFAQSGHRAASFL